MSDYRIVLCECCGSEGRRYTANGNDPHWTDWGPCEVCEGTGSEIIEVFPIEVTDAYFLER